MRPRGRTLSFHDQRHADALFNFLASTLWQASAQMAGIVLARLMAAYLRKWPACEREVALKAWSAVVREMMDD